jgi:lipoprotein-releasing system permease protein
MNRLSPFEWTVAIRFLRQGRSQTFLTVIGAAVGVAVIVFMSALLAGVQANMFSRVLSSQAHITISPRDEVARPLRNVSDKWELPTILRPAQRLRSIDQWQSISNELKLRSNVISVSPTASGSALAVRGESSRAVSLTGITPDDFYRIVNIPEKIVLGSAEMSQGNMLVGVELANKLGIGLGDKIRLRIGAVASTDEMFTIGGIFDLGNKDANERTVYIPLRAAQTLLDVRGGITALGVDLDDPYQAEIVAAELRGSLGVNAESWIAAFSELFTALRSQQLANFIIRFFVALAVALGIASVLVVTVVQRTSEIGILRAMGASRGQVLRVFLIQGAVIGMVGSIAGSAVGAGFVVLWRFFARNADGSQFFAISLPASLFLATGLIATLTGVLTAILPAIGAARLNPVDAIRG